MQTWRLESGGLLGADECKEGYLSPGVGERDQKGRGKKDTRQEEKAEPESYEWIYENGKNTEISPAYWSMHDRHVFLKG